MATLTDDLRNEYKQLFDTCIIKEDKLPDVDNVIAKMVANKATYDIVANKLNIPWYFIAIVHCMEGSLNFKTHLHNGDPLTARTVQVPKGRPLTGKPPFKWEDSAVDALTLEHLAPLADTTVPGLLFAFEGYNGFGSRAKGIHSPYLWSFSNHYTSGKFVKDHVFDPNAVSKQMGAGVLQRIPFPLPVRKTLPASPHPYLHLAPRISFEHLSPLSYRGLYCRAYSMYHRNKQLFVS